MICSVTGAYERGLWGSWAPECNYSAFLTDIVYMCIYVRMYRQQNSNIVVMF